MSGPPNYGQKFGIYKRVTEILREDGHADAENASEFERFQALLKRVAITPKEKK